MTLSQGSLSFFYLYCDMSVLWFKIRYLGPRLYASSSTHWWLLDILFLEFCLLRLWEVLRCHDTYTNKHLNLCQLKLSQIKNWINFRKINRNVNENTKHMHINCLPRSQNQAGKKQNRSSASWITKPNKGSRLNRNKFKGTSEKGPLNVRRWKCLMEFRCGENNCCPYFTSLGSEERMQKSST